jgi:thiol reductant ABC exporter CydD subunit
VRPVDPRLARRTRALRPYLAVTAVLAGVQAVLVVAGATLLARMIATAVAGAGVAEQRDRLLGLVVVAVLRGCLAGAQELFGARTAGSVKTQLRGELFNRMSSAGLDRQGPAETAVLAGPGLDALDTYLIRYLPQLVFAAVIPVLVLARLLLADRISGLTVALTLPLIPVFMALVGLTTQRLSARQVTLLTRLGAHFLDVVRGLPTLRVHRRSRAQSAIIAESAEQQRVATMRALRLAFLSSLTLELLATLSVALVAVGIGVRLVDGGLSFQTALLVLILAPEAYLPLRRLGAQHHAAADGLTAASAVLDLLDQPLGTSGKRIPAPDPARVAVRITDLTVHHPDREAPAPASLSAVLEPGQLVAVVGENGTGKSTLLRVLAGLRAADAGQVLVGGVDLADLDPDAWRERVAYLPQRPHLFAGTLAENIRLGNPSADAAQLNRAVAFAGLQELIDRLPDGLRSTVGDAGVGLSAGERRRVALARLFLRDRAGLVLLDEPTADLDVRTEAQVARSIRALAGRRTVVVVTHRRALVDVADRVVVLDELGVASGIDPTTEDER